MIRLLAASAILILMGEPTFAQSQTPGGMLPPSGMTLANSAAMRFPQPVLVGDLINREVLEPVESQNVLGTVQQVVRNDTGMIRVVINYGGFLGFGVRPIAIPVDAMVLLGQVMEVVAFTPEQLRQFATFSVGGTTPVPSDAIINVGLAKPSH